MTKWIKRDLAARTAIGVALLTVGACTAPGDSGGGDTGNTTGNTSTGTKEPGKEPVACSGLAIHAGASFAATSGPRADRFEAVAAGPDVVLATTGLGLQRSKDGGETWSAVTAKEIRGKGIGAMAAYGNDLFVADNTALWRSQDGGDTWTNASPLPDYPPTYLSASGGRLFALQGGQIHEWQGPTSSWKTLPTGEEIFDVIESDGTYLYGNAAYVGGVFRLRLDDPAATWNQVEALPEWGYHAFAFMPGQSFTANDAKLFRSVDDAKTWTTFDAITDTRDLLAVGETLFVATNKKIGVLGKSGAEWIDLAGYWSGPASALATDGKRVFAAADGVMRAAPNGGGWSRLDVRADYVGYLFPTKSSVFAFATSGLHRTTDQGATWSNLKNPTTSYYWGAPFTRHGDGLFAIGAADKLLISSDDGDTFDEIALPAHITKKLPALLASTRAGLLLGASSGAGSGCSDAQDITTTFYLSTDGGKTWSPGENHLPTTFTDCYDKDYPPAVREVLQVEGALLMASHHDGAFRSIDDGLNWKPIGDVRRFVSLGGDVFASGEKGVKKSTDGGATWSASGLDELEVRALTTADPFVFASAGAKDDPGGAIYVSTDRGATWTRLDAKFDTYADSLAVQGDRLYVGTRDQSVWSLDLSCGN